MFLGLKILKMAAANQKCSVIINSDSEYFIPHLIYIKRKFIFCHWHTRKHCVTANKSWNFKVLTIQWAKLQMPTMIWSMILFVHIFMWNCRMDSVQNKVPYWGNKVYRTIFYCIVSYRIVTTWLIAVSFSYWHVSHHIHSNNIEKNFTNEQINLH